jgi:hypothetical protein
VFRGGEIRRMDTSSSSTTKGLTMAHKIAQRADGTVGWIGACAC